MSVSQTATINGHDIAFDIHDGPTTFDQARQLAGDSIIGYNAIWPADPARPWSRWRYLHASGLVGGGGVSGWAASRDEAVEKVHQRIARSWERWEGAVHWLEAGDRTDDGEQVIRCEGWHYVLGPETSGGMRGYGGRRFVFRLLDGGREIRSTNVWLQGQIPVEFRDRLPDNAEQLDDGSTVRSRLAALADGIQ